MASRPIAHYWEAPKFLFNSPNQAAEWQAFYTRALDFLEALDIDPEAAEQNKCGWRQIKMMFEGEDCQVLQTLIDNNTVTPEAQQTPAQALKAIQSIIKEDVHFWHHHDQLFSDLCQLSEEGVHALSNRICATIAKCQFSSQEVKEIMKIMVLQHAVKYHSQRLDTIAGPVYIDVLIPPSTLQTAGSKVSNVNSTRQSSPNISSICLSK